MANQVFAPVGANQSSQGSGSTTVGGTVKLTTNGASTSVAGSILLKSPVEANAILITNAGTAGAGTAGVTVFARVSAEPSTSIVATAADIPVGLNQSILIQNPVPSGTVGIAVLSSAATNSDVYFTPVEAKMGT